MSEIRQYPTSVDLCPFCGSNAVEGSVIQADTDTAWQDVFCGDCGKEWQDVYGLLGFQEL